MIKNPDDVLEGEPLNVIEKLESIENPEYERLYLTELEGEDRLAIKQWLENKGDFSEEDMEELKQKEDKIKQAMEKEGLDDITISEALKSGEDFGKLQGKLEKIYKIAEGKTDRSRDSNNEENGKKIDEKPKVSDSKKYSADMGEKQDIIEDKNGNFDEFHQRLETVSDKLKEKHGVNDEENLDNDEEEYLQKKDRERKQEIVDEHFGDEDVDFKDEVEKKHFDLDEGETMDDFEDRVQRHKENFEKATNMMQNVIIGQDDVLEKVVVSMIVDGHILMEGVPGLGKSLTVETLSRTVSNTDFNRIQFVPDMLPSDILGQRIYNQDKGEFYTNKGPVFTNFLLADEINRAPPKTQAAMMEVMQEQKVSIEKEEYDLEPPYLVLATQNPLEQKGTYPLPEAVIDRFFIKVVLDYPSPEDEVEIMHSSTLSSINPMEDIKEVLDSEQILQAQEDVKKIHVSPKVQKYIVEIVATARGEIENNVDLMDYVGYGPGPRASIWLYLGACAYAILDGRTYALPDDVKKIAKPVMRHRIMLNYEGKISEYSPDDVTDEILEKIDNL